MLYAKHIKVTYEAAIGRVKMPFALFALFAVPSAIVPRFCSADDSVGKSFAIP